MANEYATWPILSDFQENIRKELDRRKYNTFGVNNKPRTSWIRAVSNAVKLVSGTRPVGDRGITEVGEFPEGLRRDLNIMVGGLLRASGATRGGFEPVYQRVAKGRELLDRPMPGIESVSVESKGEYGSLRKITINWFCPSVEDLDILMPYWLSPGISVMVEWGWGLIGQTPIGIDIDDDVKMAELYRFPAKIMNDVVLKARTTDGAGAGNQDFFIGIITNFSWNMNEDGSFSCTTELTTFGETMLALNLNKDVKKEGAEEEDEKIWNGIRDFVENAFNDENLQGQIDLLEDIRQISNAIQSDTSIAVSFAGGILAPTITTIPDITGDVYMTWEYIEKKIVNDMVCPMVNGNQEFLAFEMDSSQTKLTNDRMLYSRVPEIIINNNKNPNMVPFNEPPKDYDAEKYGEVNNDGFLRNVYLKRSFVIETFKKSETLKEALDVFINTIRRAGFDLWELKLQTNALAENKSQVIDQRYISDLGSNSGLNKIKTLKSNNEIFNFGGYSGQSIIRDVSFTSKMSDQVALTYFFGRNKDSIRAKNVIYSDDTDAGVSQVYGATVDRVLKNLRFKETKKPEIKQVKEEEKTPVETERIQEPFPQDDGEINWIKGQEPKETEWFYFKNENDINIVDQYLRRRKKENERKLIPIYPLEISITTDGISGILPGNVFTMDNLPKAFRDNGVFQIVEISHDIGPEDWTTKLRAFFRPVYAFGKEPAITNVAAESTDKTIDEGFIDNEPAQ